MVSSPLLHPAASSSESESATNNCGVDCLLLLCVIIRAPRFSLGSDEVVSVVPLLRLLLSLVGLRGG
jgi:hypothetical protein